MPKSPPDASPKYENLGQLIIKLGSLLQDPTFKGRYLHWDKLQFQPAPPHVTHEEWWFALKWARRSLLKPIPLVDASGTPFRFATPDSALELLHNLDKNLGGAVLLPTQTLNAASRDQYIIRSLVEEAITSSQLEGAATTREVAKKMLRTGRPPRDRDEQMILNNYRAMRQIRELKDHPLTPQVILQLHRTLTVEAMDNPQAVGRYRLASEHIAVEDDQGEVLHTPPPAESLEQRVQAMCDFANQTDGPFVHPVIRAIILHFWLAYDHPFVDGNGRCARALFYWSMLRSGYWLCEFISISHVIRKAPIKYGRAFLYTETDENDLTYFVLYHLEMLHKAIEELHAYIKRKSDETREVEQTVNASAHFNHRQLAVLSRAIRHPDSRFTLSEHQHSQNIVYQTARMDLFSLVERGLLETRKVGRKFIFVPVSDLPAKLRDAT